MIVNFLLDNSKNPYTGRKIKQDGKVYKRLEKELDSKFKSCRNTRDPITLEDYKKEDMFNYKIYTEDGSDYLFKIESLEYMKGMGITKNPITNKDFNKEFLEGICSKEIKYTNDIEDYILRTLEKFRVENIFIEEKLFLELPENKLNALFFEINSVYFTYFNYEVFNVKQSTFTKYDKNKKLKCLFDGINNIINKHNNLYMLVGCFGLVIKKILNDYPQFSFIFQDK